eukprot:GCRY01007050.1.p1 GENE.GCRY01007050.1~~GCRY01007050.1.p1  ORF type:complete len:288 (+),score=17.86 GCRY01007050.1:626-1489(+)
MMQEKTEIKHFIEEYSDVHGLPDPNEKNVILLPSNMGPSFLHEEYVEAMKIRNKRALSRRNFSEVWKLTLPYIKAQNPRSDVCSLCDQLSRTMPSLNGEELEEKLNQLQNHRKKAHDGRNKYKEDKTNARNIQEELRCQIRDSLSPNAQTTPNNTFTLTVPLFLSFDYAQQVHVPHSSQQVGEVFFKTPRKIQLFGVTFENIPFFFLYLIDESESAGKGVDAVISLVHHTIFTQLRKIKSKTLQMQADNCSGQNKNNAFLHFLLYLVHNGFFESVSLSFMVAGHRKV